MKYFFGYEGLVDQALAQKLPVNTYAADRGYDDGNNHFYLEYHHLKSAICLKDVRKKKKDANAEGMLCKRSMAGADPNTG